MCRQRLTFDQGCGSGSECFGRIRIFPKVWIQIRVRAPRSNFIFYTFIIYKKKIKEYMGWIRIRLYLKIWYGLGFLEGRILTKLFTRVGSGSAAACWKSLTFTVKVLKFLYSWSYSTIHSIKHAGILNLNNSEAELGSILYSIFILHKILDTK